MNNRTILKRFLFLVILSIFLYSCGNSEKQSYIVSENERETYYSDDDEKVAFVNLEETSDLITSSPDAPPPPPPPSVSELTDENSDLKIEKKIIKTAILNIELKEYAKNKVLIDTLVSKWSGYISEEYETRNDFLVSNNLKIRVPNEQFDFLINEIIAIASKIDTKQITAEDVTDQYVDVYMRLQTKKEVEQQYMEILKKAYTISDIINVTEQLRQIREEIEAKEGQLKFMDNQVSYSTINLYVYENFTPAEVQKNNFWQKVGDSFVRGWNGILIFFIGIFSIWPVLIIIAVIVLLIVRKVRKSRKINK